MKWTSYPERFPEASAEIPLVGGHMEDADGKWLAPPAIYVDTETGVSVEYIKTANGHQMNLRQTLFQERVVVYKAPLRLFDKNGCEIHETELDTPVII